MKLPHATNIEMIVLSFYLGKGGRALGNIAGALGLPKPQTFEKMFSRHADTVGEAIRKLVKKIEHDNMRAEILASYQASEKTKLYDDSIFCRMAN